MRALLLVVSLTTVVLARPDIGLDLRSKPLATSYGVPSASITNLNEHSFLPPSPTFETPLLSTAVPFYSGPVSTSAPPVYQSIVSSTPAPFYGAPTISSTPSPFYGVPTISSTPSPLYGAPTISTTPAPFYEGPLLTNNLIGSPSLSSGGLIYNQGAPIFGGQDLSSLQQSSQFIGASSQAEVQKHVYFYEAPQEPEDVRPVIKYPVAPLKKNVKIIFIKAPQYSVPVYPPVPLQSQNQEKTIVYVLVKKPDEQEQIIVPTVPPTQPAKPEVYFIKYKNQQEAEEKVSNTLNEHSNSGANIISNGVQTAPIASGGFVDSSFIGNQIISSTESPFGLIGVDGGFLGTSTLAPLIDGSYSAFGSGVAVSGNGIAGQFGSSTEPTIINSTPYTYAPIHPTYGPPKEK